MDVDVFKNVLIAKHDEGIAQCRDWVIRQGGDEVGKYLERLFREMQSSDAAKALAAHFAVLGLIVAWLSALDQQSQQAVPGGGER